MQIKYLLSLALLIALLAACAPADSSLPATELPLATPGILSTATPLPTLTEAPTDTPPPSPTPSPTPIPYPEPLKITEYTILAGDTCSSVAVAHRIKLDALMQANPGLVCSKLQPGEKLAILPAGIRLFSHDLDKGDTCQSIAMQFDTDPVTLLALNPKLDLNGSCDLQKYQMIQIPKEDPSYILTNEQLAAATAVVVLPTPKPIPTLAKLPTSPPAASGFDPSKPSALCKDGTYSYSKHRSGTCSGHKGVAQWLQAVPN